MAFDFTFIQCKRCARLLFNKIIIGFFCSPFNNRPLKDAAWKTEYFCKRYFRKRRTTQHKKNQSNVSQVKRSPRAKIQLFLSTFKLAEKSGGRSWNNSNILINNNTIFFKQWYQNGIIHLQDLLDVDCTLIE